MLTHIDTSHKSCEEMICLGSTISLLPLEEIVGRYLHNTPLAYTLFRSAECRHIRQLTISRPALDLGCSVGEFAEYALEEKLDLGIDLSAGRLALARQAGGHRALAQADAGRLPIADDCFASVVAVSVCEHFADPTAAIAEVYRVLKPGGRFIATIVLEDMHSHLFYPRLLRRTYLGWLATLYLGLHNLIFKHCVLESRQWWKSRLTEGGFDVIVARKIVAPRLTAWFDFWLATAWPYRLWQRFGKPWVWRPKWFEQWCWKTFIRLDTDEDEGAVLFVVAEKPATG